jgi:hypothetical protein
VITGASYDVSDIFWFPAIWLAAAAGSFLRYLNRGPKELFFRDN